MRPNATIPALVLSLCVMAPCWRPSATVQDLQETSVGWIAILQCSGEWRENDRAATRPLSPKADLFRFLYPGESVRCNGGGFMSLQILDNSPPKKIVRSDGWCTIYDEEALCEKEKSSRRGASESLRLKTEAVNAFGRAAGRQRAPGAEIFCPAFDSTVRGDKLVFRWNQIPGATQLSLRLTDKYHAVLWEQDGVDANAKQLVSPEARLALTRYLDKGGAGPFNLILTNGSLEQPPVQFSILTAADEHTLDGDLAACARQLGLLRSVCRAYSFAQRGMWNDFAEEHEAALKLAPGSRDLLRTALAAEKSVGNTSRASELASMLPEGTPPPD